MQLNMQPQIDHDCEMAVSQKTVMIMRHFYHHYSSLLSSLNLHTLQHRRKAAKVIAIYKLKFNYSHHNQGRRYRGAGGPSPPLFIQGGSLAPQKLFDHSTELSTKIALLLARNLHCKNRINFQAQLIKQTRGFAFVF